MTYSGNRKRTAKKRGRIIAGLIACRPNSVVNRTIIDRPVGTVAPFKMTLVMIRAQGAGDAKQPG